MSFFGKRISRGELDKLQEIKDNDTIQHITVSDIEKWHDENKFEVKILFCGGPLAGYEFELKEPLELC